MSLESQIQALQQILNDSVSLLAVSKTQSIENIQQAYFAGIRHFGENYLNEAQEKILALKHLDCQWHYIGLIQTKKCKKLAELFDWVQTVCSESIAQELNRCNELLAKRQNILIQVKVLPDENKAGCSFSQCLELMEKIKDLPHLRLRGLMCILPLGLDEQAQYHSFASLKKFFDECNESLDEPMDTLSMGMSDDYLVALRAGSNMIRLGRVIFGERL
ncbi:MAG TPA: YggS family pyridoxal phosphate-dependent enzyme [Legionellales bacterium]|nr:YggS family pyridoxal phosphate-dependent enzyme [Legionellales bacterium]